MVKWHRNVENIFIALLLVITGLAQSCGKADKIKNWDDGNDFNLDDQNTNSALTREWSGVLKDKRPEAAVKLMPVSIAFNADGSFNLRTTDESNGSVSGTYARFPATILFSIQLSTISIFGLDGSQHDINYSLLGRTLTIFNDSMELKLLAGPPPSENTPIIIKANDPLAGSWVGSDRAGNGWTIVIDYGGNFTVQVTNEANNPMQMGGKLSFKNPSNSKLGFLNVSQSNNPNTVDTKLAFEISIDGSTLEIVIFDKEDQEIQTLVLEKST